MSAYFAIFAPKIPGTQVKGPIRLHKALAWIHGPGMILTPILGAMAFDEKSKGERVHGIASAHGAVADRDGGCVWGGDSLVDVQMVGKMVEANFLGELFGELMSRNRKLLFALVAVALTLIVARDCAAQDSHWVLEQSTLTYHVSHPLHQVDGVSHAVRGKAVCHAGECDFLIAVAVKSFDSGDSNRDLHMQQVTKAGQFPLVTVRTQLPETLAGAATINADLEVEFAGQTVHYKQVPFQQVTEGDQVRITGAIPTKVSDFKIDPPSLFAIAIKNDIPVQVEMTWRREK